ncbi:hypothetical protein ISN45_At04g008600 [Arabidopsis thaliana x Arabidopsis arenosa]|uniref:Uncharacterized protein n=1 Tax=Arabidopsis thaliana x Arabidopsis arenosa TaxID=1240361 RepID=A0A8T2DWV2_9BRAS|nr:hypothetical protein ISN45_At04g008600 [Arabidopsis thaliana x Arabidopsis arenosa]
MDMPDVWWEDRIQAREEKEGDRRFPQIESKTQELNRTPRGLPSQYDFRPPDRQPPLQDPDRNPIAQAPTGATVRDYPPPTQLFQSGEGSPCGSGSIPFRASGSTQPRFGGSVHRLPCRSNQTTAPVKSSAPIQREAPIQTPVVDQQRPLPHPRPSVSSHHSSQGQYSHDEEDEEEEDECEDDLSREPTLSSTITNDRGEYYGVGSLRSYINGKRKYQGTSSSFTTLQSQLEKANHEIEEQATLQAHREAEALWVADEQAEIKRVANEQQAEIKRLMMVKKYLTATDPNFLAFLESSIASEDTTEEFPKLSFLLFFVV